MRRDQTAIDYGLKLPQSNGTGGSMGFCAGGGVRGFVIVCILDAKMEIPDKMKSPDPGGQIGNPG